MKVIYIDPNDRFVRNVGIVTVRKQEQQQEQQLAERKNVYKLLELPGLFKSRWNEGETASTTTTAETPIELKSASVLDEVTNANSNERLSRLLELGSMFRGNNTQYY
jgi:penicillin V acylase-like amidase (Ntn superfamily)